MTSLERPRADLLFETFELAPYPLDYYSPYIETRDAYRVLIRATGWGEPVEFASQHFLIEEHLDTTGGKIVAWHRPPIEPNSSEYRSVNYLFTPAARYFRFELANPSENENIVISVRAVPGGGTDGMV